MYILPWASTEYYMPGKKKTTVKMGLLQHAVYCCNKERVFITGINEGSTTYIVATVTQSDAVYVCDAVYYLIDVVRNALNMFPWTVTQAFLAKVRIEVLTWKSHMDTRST